MNPAVAAPLRVARTRTESARYAFLAPRQVVWLAALIAAAQLPHFRSVPVWVSVAGAAIVALRLFLLHRDRMHPGAPPTRVPAWVLIACAVGVAGAVRTTYGYFLGREPCVAFLYVLVATKFLEARDTRDGALLVCLASFLVVTPFFYSQSVLAAIAAAPAIVLAGAVLDVLARQRWPGKAETSWTAPLARASRMLLHGIPLAAVLFVLFPRLATPLWGLPADHAGTTGLSDRMAPGSISELSLSDAIAFRVDFDGPIPAPRQRYWRGPVLSSFDGREWTHQPQRLDGTLARTNAPSIGYTVTLEPHFKAWLFALDLPSALPLVTIDPETIGSPHAGEVASLTRSQQLVARTLVTQPLRYRQRSVLSDRYAADRSVRCRRESAASPAQQRRQPEDARVCAGVARRPSRRRRLHSHGARVVYARGIRLHAGTPASRSRSGRRFPVRNAARILRALRERLRRPAAGGRDSGPRRDRLPRRRDQSAGRLHDGPPVRRPRLGGGTRRRRVAALRPDGRRLAVAHRIGTGRRAADERRGADAGAPRRRLAEGGRAHVGRNEPRLARPDHRLQLRKSTLALAGLECRPAGGVAVCDARRGVRAGVGRAHARLAPVAAPSARSGAHPLAGTVHAARARRPPASAP